MLIPTYQQTNFFEDPYSIIEYSKNLTFSKPETGKYPGARSKPLHLIDENFCHSLNIRILKLVFGDLLNDTEFRWFGNSYFQKIKYEDIDYSRDGWIHTDSDQLMTSIIYLTPGNLNCGTNIYEPKSLSTKVPTLQEKFDYYKGKKIKKNDYLKALEKSNKDFTKIAEFKSVFNSMIMFDGSNYHKANFNMSPGEERLTLITFYKRIYSPFFPSAEYNRRI